MRIASPLLALLLAGCSSPTIADAVNDVLADSGLSYASCGTFRVPDHCSDTGATPPGPVQCLIDAEAACKPAHLTVTSATLEGDAIHTAYVVSPRDGGCSVITIRDTRQDDFGPQALTTSRCTTFTKEEACPWVSTSGCAEM